MTNRLDRWKRRALFALFMLLVLPGLAGCTSGVSALGEPLAASDLNVDPWPRQLASGDDTFSLFQPQYESWDQGRLSGRAAVAAENRVSPQPRYGVIWFTARTEVDKEARGRARGRDHLEGRFPDGAGRRGRLPHGAAADRVKLSR